MEAGDWVALACGAFLAAVVAALGFVGVDYLAGRTVIVPCTVVDRAYQGPSTHVGNTVDGDGKVRLVVTHEPEHYRLIVRTAVGVEARGVSAETWAASKPGDSIRLPFTVGRLTGHRY
jgi:hypothetical protein